jgi:hypothetical protein
MFHKRHKKELPLVSSCNASDFNHTRLRSDSYLSIWFRMSKPGPTVWIEQTFNVTRNTSSTNWASHMPWEKGMYSFGFFILVFEASWGAGEAGCREDCGVTLLREDGPVLGEVELRLAEFWSAFLGGSRVGPCFWVGCESGTFLVVGDPFCEWIWTQAECSQF